MFLICISLMMNEVEHAFHMLVDLVAFLNKN